MTAMRAWKHRARRGLATRLAPHVAARFEGTLASLPPLADLDHVVRTMWLRRWIRGHELDRRTDPFDAARTLADDLRGVLVTQRQTGLEVRDSIEDDDFMDRRITLLVSGLSNCELMAVCLADALRALGHSATVWSTGDAAEHHGAHTLVHLEAPTGTAFVDAWSDVRVMHVSGVRSANRGPDRAPPGSPDRASLTGLSIEANGIYPASAYRSGHAKRLPERRWRPLGAVRDWSRAHACAPIWVDYVELRLRDLFGELPDAASAYRTLGERELPQSLQVTLARLAESRRRAVG